MEFKHTSVLLEETIQNLRVKPDGIYIDGTLGGGGHSYHIASGLTGTGRLFWRLRRGSSRFRRKLRSFGIITVIPVMY